MFVVMVDQFCGDFYVWFLGLLLVVSDSNSCSILKVVKEVCFEVFDGGFFGVVNGLCCDGIFLDFNGIYLFEVWMGINFGIVSYYCLMGDKQMV